MDNPEPGGGEMNTPSAREGVRSEINVTPLVDVCLVLLIIFMVVTPLMYHESAVNLPESGRPGSLEAHKQLAVTMQLDGLVKVDGALVPLSELPGQLRRLHEADSERPVIIEGDRQLRYEQLSQVIESVEDAGFQKFGLITVRRSRG
jgi:biopolymer transport protein TolR